MAVPKVSFLVTAATGGQYEQTFNVRVIGSLHRVGCKDQMISHPYRIETIRFGLDRAFQAFFRRSMLTKMRQHQAEFKFAVMETLFHGSLRICKFFSAPAA